MRHAEDKVPLGTVRDWSGLCRGRVENAGLGRLALGQSREAKGSHLRAMLRFGIFGIELYYVLGPIETLRRGPGWDGMGVE